MFEDNCCEPVVFLRADMGDRDEHTYVGARGTVTGVRDGEWIAVDVPGVGGRFLPMEIEGDILFERTPFKYLKEGGGGQNKDPEPHHIVAELDICEHCGLHKERHTRVGGDAEMHCYMLEY